MDEETQIKMWKLFCKTIRTPQRLADVVLHVGMKVLVTNDMWSGDIADTFPRVQLISAILHDYVDGGPYGWWRGIRLQDAPFNVFDPRWCRPVDYTLYTGIRTLTEVCVSAVIDDPSKTVAMADVLRRAIKPTTQATGD